MPKQPKYRSYMICTAPRSGSTLLCGQLAATGRAGNPDSYLHRQSLDEWLSDHDLTREAYASDREAAAAVLAAAQKKGEAGTGIFGLRMQRPSFAFFMEQAAALFPGVPTDADRIRAAFGETLYIHLSRRDKLAQAISMVKAEQTGLWHRNADGSELERLAPPCPPAYDARRIRDKIETLTALDAEWPDWFAREGIKPLCLIYEDLSADLQDALARVLAALDLDPNLAEAVKTPTAKLADEISQQWAARFRAERA